MKWNVGVAIGLVLVLCSGLAVAQSNTSVTIGGNYWRGTIKAENITGDNTTDKASNLIGPFINVRFDKITLGGSWFFGSWDFSQSDYTYKIKRNDLNFSLGYSINSNITLFGAYKILKLTEEFGWESMGITNRENTIWNVPYYGGGLSVTYPFPNSPLFLFGSAAYLTHAKDKFDITQYDYFSEMDVTYEQKVDDNITSFTVGLGFRLNSGISILGGYRADSHKSKDENTGNNLKINGLMVTLAYTLR
jgi:hypothetical protein